MNCPNCHQSVETGAAFCGNCGQQLASAEAAVQQAYAIATPLQHQGETRALLATVFGVAGLVGAVLVPILGIGLGLAGIMQGTLSRNGPKRGLSTAGLILGSLAILGGLANWIYVAQKEAHAQPTISSSASATASLSTSCYSANLIDRLNVVIDTKGCTSKAYNGQTMEASTDAYKILASKSTVTDAGGFTELAKPALEKDLQTNLGSFTLDSERVSGFAGSPAYTVNASDKASGVAITETAVYHPTTSGNNIFILVHAISGKTADLHILEAQWQWK